MIFAKFCDQVECSNPNGSPARSNYVSVPPRAHARRGYHRLLQVTQTYESIRVMFFWCIFAQGSISNQDHQDLKFRSRVMVSFIGRVPPRARREEIIYNSITAQPFGPERKAWYQNDP